MSDTEQGASGLTAGEPIRDSVDMRVFERAVANRKKIMRLEADLRAAKEERDTLEEQILEVFASTGMDSGTFGGMTVYPYPDVRASVKAGKMPEFCEIMRRMGYEEVVKETVNANTLTSIVKSMREKDGDDIPPEMAELLNILERWKVGYRQR